MFGLKQAMNNLRKRSSKRRQGTTVDFASSSENKTVKDCHVNSIAASSYGKTQPLDYISNRSTLPNRAELDELHRSGEGGQERATVSPGQINSEKDTWSILASDVIFYLRKWLSLKDCLSVRLVNKHWSIAGRSFITGIELCNENEFTSTTQLCSLLRYFSDESFHQLRRLKISQFKDGYDSLSYWTKLTSLDISGLSVDVHQYAAALQSLVNLTSLNLGWTQLNDEGMQYISGLTNLSILCLEWCHHLTETSISSIVIMTNLSHLSLCGLYCETETCLQPIQNLKKLNKLDLSGMYLSERALSPLSNLTNLTELNLSANDITSQSLEEISGLCHIKRLDLSRTKIDNIGLLKLRSLQRLTDLNLSDSSIDDHGLNHLTRFKLLSKLNLSDNYMLCWRNLHYLMPLTKLTLLHWINLERTQADKVGVEMFIDAVKPRKITIVSTNLTRYQ
eukprot:g3925.t1